MARLDTKCPLFEGVVLAFGGEAEVDDDLAVVKISGMAINSLSDNDSFSSSSLSSSAAALTSFTSSSAGGGCDGGD